MTEAPRPSGPAPDTADRDAYRRGPSDEPKGGAGANFNPGFVSFALSFKFKIKIKINSEIQVQYVKPLKQNGSTYISIVSIVCVVIVQFYFDNGGDL